MTPEQWAQVRRIFESALDCEPERRGAFVARMCGGDVELMREVSSLLSHDASAAEFINEPVFETVSRTAFSQIGHYRILGVLGEGGMGTVYEAEQEKPSRIVALKVIKPGFTNPESLRRFEQESRALGRLQHPGIAQIFEAGTADAGFGPQPFFAMEFVRGETLRKHVEAQGLNARQRLELMVRICEAVEHAHQRGLIHRDLKPANILVDATGQPPGQPKILDFGVARVTDSDAYATQHTDLGQLVGTLAYMSPEQVLADPLELDTRSDVYALGVILYELLSGRRPYELSPKLHEAVRVIREQDPPPLSSIDRVYRGDVETIAAKALEKDKTRRYGSAAHLAEDIRRYLNHEPILGRPPSATYRLQKFARRNRALVAGVAAVFLVLVGGIIVSTWQARRANIAGKTALAESASAKAVSDFLQNDVLAQASSNTQAGPDNKPDPDLKVRTALDRAAARISGKFGKQPLVEASIRQTIGNTYYELGAYREAQAQVEGALTLRRTVLGNTHPDTLASMVSLAGLLVDQGNYAQAESLYNEALEARRRAPDETRATDTEANMSDLALLYLDEGKYSQAEPLFTQVLDIRRRTRGEEHPDTLSSMNNLALLYRHQGKYSQAEPLYVKALGMRSRVLGEEHPDTLITMSNLAWLYMSEGKFGQAEPLLSKALAIRRRVLGEQHPDTLISLDGLAGVYADQGKYAQAEALYTKSVEIWRRIVGEQHRDTLVSTANLARLYVSEHKYDRAELLYTKVLNTQRRVLGEDHPDSLTSMAGLADLFRKESRYSEAEGVAKKVVDARRRVLGPQHPGTTAAALLLGEVWLQEKKYSEAERLLRDMPAISDTWRRYYGQSLLGASLAGEKKYADAEPLLLNGYKGMKEREATIPSTSRSALEDSGLWVVQLYEQWGRAQEATKWRKTLQKGSNTPAPGDKSHAPL